MYRPPYYRSCRRSIPQHSNCTGHLLKASEGPEARVLREVLRDEAMQGPHKSRGCASWASAAATHWAQTDRDRKYKAPAPAPTTGHSPVAQVCAAAPRRATARSSSNSSLACRASGWQPRINRKGRKEGRRQPCELRKGKRQQSARQRALGTCHVNGYSDAARRGSGA